MVLTEIFWLEMGPVNLLYSYATYKPLFAVYVKELPKLNETETKPVVGGIFKLSLCTRVIPFMASVHLRVPFSL